MFIENTLILFWDSVILFMSFFSCLKLNFKNDSMLNRTKLLFFNYIRTMLNTCLNILEFSSEHTHFTLHTLLKKKSAMLNFCLRYYFFNVALGDF